MLDMKMKLPGFVSKSSHVSPPVVLQACHYILFLLNNKNLSLHINLHHPILDLDQIILEAS
jgi:hypothetical protein